MHLHRVVSACTLPLKTSPNNVSLSRISQEFAFTRTISASRNATNVSLHIEHFGRNLGAGRSTIKRSKWLATACPNACFHVGRCEAELFKHHVPFCSGSSLGTQNPYWAACIRLTSCARHRCVSQTCQSPEPIYWKMHESGDILQLEHMPSFSGFDSWLPRMPQANGKVERVSCRLVPTRRHTRCLLDQIPSFVARETAGDVQVNSMEAPNKYRTDKI